MVTKKNQKIITIACFSFFILCVSVFLWEGIYVPKTYGVQETRIFSVKKGEGINEISTNLEKQGFIKYDLLFKVYVLILGVAGKLQAGDYLFSPAMTIPEITEKLVAGDVIRQRITIIEGWNLRDIIVYLKEKELFSTEEFIKLVGLPMVDYSKRKDLPPPKDFSEEFDFLKDKPKNLSLEGYLFPDTYEIQKDDPLEEIARKMLTNFEKKLVPYRNEIASSKKTYFEIITMASLIEKEVKTLEDKKLVSGILWKRLNHGIPLQVDAAITYITGKKTTKISIKETQIDSPYNIYKYQGLPLGPICNPGLESITAALYPEKSEYWYYLSTPEGETIFSKTLKEHNLAKAKYLK